MPIQGLEIEQNLRICNAAQEYYSLADNPSILIAIGKGEEFKFLK